MIKLLRFLPAFFAVLGLIAMPGTALPQSKKDGMEKKAKQHKHKNGKDLLGAKLKKGGEHKIHANGKHSAFVQVSNGKVTGVKVRHADKGDVPVTKYKSKKKMADASDSGFQTDRSQPCWASSIMAAGGPSALKRRSTILPKSFSQPRLRPPTVFVVRKTRTFSSTERDRSHF